MHNGNGEKSGTNPRPTSFEIQPPLGRLRVVYNTGIGMKYERLDNTPNGVFAIAGGTIQDVHLHGDDDEPRATFTLVDSSGDRAIVAVDTNAYFDAFGDIVDGAEAELRGTVVRPFTNGPAHLQMLSLYKDD